MPRIEFADDCCCGRESGTNDDCERCQLIARLKRAEETLSKIRSSLDKPKGFITGSIGEIDDHLKAYEGGRDG